MTVIVTTATIIGLASLTNWPIASVSGDQINFQALLSGCMSKQYSVIPILSKNTKIN